ncbi:RnfH family protein [Ramlibacter sp. H39-3-26]|nr:RnfH family protein [Ramlibacter sp. H39-3-26]MDF1485385.1 RnfH family protein [Ramlibacter sp. H39-3-26]
MLRVTVAYAPRARQVVEIALELPRGATVADALRAALRTEPALADAPPDVGVWGRKAQPRQALRDHDRVEIYRPLLVDPKVARRERFRKQGARATGLFARRRPGGKPGY